MVVSFLLLIIPKYVLYISEGKELCDTVRVRIMRQQSQAVSLVLSDNNASVFLTLRERLF